MKRNVELLREVRDLVTREPAKFDMGIWIGVEPDLIEFPEGVIKAKVTCSTVACVAGWAVQLSGDKLLVHREDVGTDGIYRTGESVAKNGRICDIERRARKLLGLSREEADTLFFADSNQTAIDMLETLIAGGSISSEYDYEDFDDDDED